MRVITETPSNRETVIGFTDRELQIIEAALDNVTDGDAYTQGTFELWEIILDTIENDLALDTIDITDQSA